MKNYADANKWGTSNAGDTRPRITSTGEAASNAFELKASKSASSCNAVQTMTSSTSEAMRLIKQGGVKINSEKVSDTKLEIKKGSEAVYQVGKRKFLHIKIN